MARKAARRSDTLRNSYNAMTSEPNSLAVWTPSPKQQAVAQRYAMGYSWHRCSVLTGVAWTTVSAWREPPAGKQTSEFVDYCEALRRDILTSAEPQFAAVIERAQAILLRVGDDLGPDAPLAAWAERILSRTLWPVAVASGLAKSGIAITGQQALRMVAGNYGDKQFPEGGDR